MTDTSIEETGDTGGADDTAADETLARERGWRPESDWRGATDGWLDAPEFLARNKRLADRGDEINKQEIRHLTGLVQKQEATISRLAKTVTGFNDWQERATVAGYKRALAALKGDQRKAVAEGDQEAFDTVEKQIGELTTEVQQTMAAKKTDSGEAAAAQQANPDDDPGFRAFTAENSWYNRNVKLTAYANDVAAPIVFRGLGNPSGPPTPEFYERVAEAVRDQFPDAFDTNGADEADKPRPRRAAKVEAIDGSRGGAKGRKPGYADLDEAAKLVCGEIVRRGEMTQTEWLKMYYENES